jgi:hypothetical protein
MTFVPMNEVMLFLLFSRLSFLFLFSDAIFFVNSSFFLGLPLYLSFFISHYRLPFSLSFGLLSKSFSLKLQTMLFLLL